jgi:UDP-glucose 4-epimerase
MAAPRDAPVFAGAKCLVTGGLGFIGSNLTLALMDAGAQVTVVDRLEPRHGGRIGNLDGAAPRTVIADISDVGAVSEPAAEADFVFNLAGQVSHIDSMEAPVHDLDLNARSQLGFLEILRRTSSRARVVYASTRQVYGRPVKLPVGEEHPLRPVDVNGVTKLAAERLHLVYSDVYEIPVTVLRLSNIYGPRQRLDGNHLGFLPVFIRRALRGESIALCGDGTQRRDCLFIDDTVDALLAAAATPAAAGETFNIGHTEYRSLREIAELMIAATRRGHVEIAPWPADRLRIAIGSFQTDGAKARKVLGWAPSVDLRVGIDRTIGYYRAHGEWPA